MAEFRGLVALLAPALIALGLTGPASAQTYPTHNVRLIVPFAAGGPTDVIARVVAQKLSEAWGQQIVVENVPGAGGNTGVAMVAKAAPDGYTMLVVSHRLHRQSEHVRQGAVRPDQGFRTGYAGRRLAERDLGEPPGAGEIA